MRHMEMILLCHICFLRDFNRLVNLLAKFSLWIECFGLLGIPVPPVE